MARSSSIFSFDTLAALPRPTRAFWLTLSLCVACRALLWAGADRFEAIPAESMNMFYERLERVDIRQAQARPRVLLMGNSLMRYGLLEDRITDSAGLDRGEVVNLALNSGRPWEASLFVRRNPELSARVQLVVLNIHRHQLEERTATKHLERFYRYSTFSEKLAADGLMNKAALLSDWVWPYWTERRRLVTWAAALLGGAEDEFQTCFLPVREAWLPEILPRWHAKEVEFSETPPLESYEGRHPLSPLHVRAFCDFVDYWRQRQVNVVLLGTPVKRLWLDGMLQVPDAREDFLEFDRFVRGLTDERVVYIPWYTANQCGVDDPADFLDWSHLTPDGAHKMTDAFIVALNDRGLLPLDTTPALPQQYQASAGQ